jgi:hypothetical protein
MPFFFKSRKTCFCVSVIGSLIWHIASSSAETVYTMDFMAACRNSAGRVLNPRVSPTIPFIADRTSFGMVRARKKINGEDCFFYMFEVGLTPRNGLNIESCPDAAVGDKNNSPIVGTRGQGNCR